MEYVTIPGVEVGSVGMQWKASNGLFTCTMQNLADVAVAANDDPHIVVPRLKLGHDGWPEMSGLDNSPFGTSAEPAFGRLKNLRLVNDGATLIGDYVDVPAWLPAAYPSRSGEWLDSTGLAETGVVTPGGKRYSMVLTAVALLGVALPAIQDIDDLEQFLTTGTVGRPTTVTTSTTEVRMPQPIATRADIPTVERSFWSDFAQGDYFWWWPRDIYTDPNEVLADDDEGHLFRVPYTSNADGEVTWGAPVRVALDMRDLPPLTPDVAAASYRAVMATSAEQHRTFATAAAARPTERHTQRAATDVAAATHQAAATAGSDNEETPMDATVLKALARQHGLDPETATEDEVNAAVIAAGEAESTETEAPETVVEVEPAETVDEEVADPIAAEQARALEEATSRIAELEAQAATRAETETRERRDALATSWVQEGRITPAEHEHYRSLLEVDEERTKALATSLAPGRVPVKERAAAAATASSSEDALLAASRARMGHTPKEA